MHTPITPQIFFMEALNILSPPALKFHRPQYVPPLFNPFLQNGESRGHALNYAPSWRSSGIQI